MCESAEMIGKSTCTSPPQGSKVVSIRPLSRGRRQRDPVGRGVLRHALMLADRGAVAPGSPDLCWYARRAKAARVIASKGADDADCPARGGRAQVVRRAVELGPLG